MKAQPHEKSHFFSTKREKKTEKKRHSSDNGFLRSPQIQKIFRRKNATSVVVRALIWLRKITSGIQPYLRSVAPWDTRLHLVTNAMCTRPKP